MSPGIRQGEVGILSGCSILLRKYVSEPRVVRMQRLVAVMLLTSIPCIRPDAAVWIGVVLKRNGSRWRWFCSQMSCR